VHREPQFLPVVGALQFGCKDLALHVAFFVVVFGTAGSGERRKVMHSDKTRGSIAHRPFIQRKRVMQDVAPQHRRHDLAAVDTIAVNLSIRGPSRAEIRSGLLSSHNSNRGRQERIQGPLEFTG
jgi:hypothetical protein